MTPYFSARSPPEHSATLPPSVAVVWLPGSGGKSRPCAAAAVASSTVRTPGWQTATRSSTLTSIRRFMRVRTSTMPPRLGTVPALRFVPDPRGTTGTRSSSAIRTIPATSSVEPGKTTTSGAPRSSGVASVEKASSVPASSRTCSAPATCSSRARRSVAGRLAVAMARRFLPHGFAFKCA